MGAVNSHIYRHLQIRRRNKKVRELRHGTLPASCVEINNERLITSSSPVTSTASVESPPAPLIPPLPSPSASRSSDPDVVGCNLPGGIEELEVAMPTVRVLEQQPRRSSLPPAFRGPLEKMDIIKRKPKKLPPLSVPFKKVSPLKQIVMRRKLGPLPPLLPINDVFTEPNVLQDIEENDVKFGIYLSCKQTRSGKAVSFELVFPDNIANGTKPAFQQRSKSSRRKLKKQITEKLKAANERKMVSEYVQIQSL